MPVPINKFTIADICNELEIPISSSIEDIFLNSNIIEGGLDPTYCTGISDLQSLPYNIGKWRNYTAYTEVACGVQSVYPGGIGYPTTISITLGSTIGTVSLVDVTPQGIPDRFIVYYDNVVVIDTGYVSLLNNNYDIGGNFRNDFKSACYGKLDPITNETYPDFTNYPDDGYPRVNSIGSYSFSKNNVNVTSAIVKVYAPMAGTYWAFKLTCPA